MTAAEFEREYAERSGLTVEELRQDNVILACACGEEGMCRGWAAVPNDPHSIKAHNRFYAPKDPSPCIARDPLCPCQDGDTCNYAGKNPLPLPKA